MRNTYILVAVLFGVTLCVGVFTAAQEAKDRGEIELTRMQVQTNRQQVIKDYMHFTPQESELFWPVYRNYHNSLAKIEDRQVKILDEFTKNYKNLTDKQASSLLKESLQLKMDKLDAVASYGLVGAVPLAE